MCRKIKVTFFNSLMHVMKFVLGQKCFQASRKQCDLHSNPPLILSHLKKKYKNQNNNISIRNNENTVYFSTRYLKL